MFYFIFFNEISKTIGETFLSFLTHLQNKMVENPVSFISPGPKGPGRGEAGGGGGGGVRARALKFRLWSPEPDHFTGWSPDPFLAVEHATQRFEI